MQVKTQRELIKDIAKTWKRFYFRERFGGWEKDSYEEEYNQLINLNLEIATAAEVHSIIGDHGFLTYWCHCCGAMDKENIIEAYEDGEGQQVQICFDCVDRMHTLISKRGF